MKKKLLWFAGIIVLIALVALGICRWVQVRNHQTDPNWKIAEQIFGIENALKEVDEDYEYKSIAKVTPYTYADPGGAIRSCITAAKRRTLKMGMGIIPD